MLPVSKAVVAYNLGKFMSCFPCPFVIFLSGTDFCVWKALKFLGKFTDEIHSQFYEHNWKEARSIFF